jgi:hypothetical protein
MCASALLYMSEPETLPCRLCLHILLLHLPSRLQNIGKTAPSAPLPPGLSARHLAAVDALNMYCMVLSLN